MPINQNIEDDGYPDDWFVPESTGAGTSFADDWVYPDDWTASTPSTQLGGAQSTPSPRADPAIPRLSSSAPPPDPFAVFWSLVPADKLREVAWAPPTFSDASRQYPQSPFTPPPEPPQIRTVGGLFDSLANLQTPSIPPLRPPMGGLLDPTTNLPRTFGLPNVPTSNTPNDLLALLQPTQPALNLPSTDASFPQLQADPGTNNQFLSYSAFGSPTGAALDPGANVVGESDPSIFDSSALGPSKLDTLPVAGAGAPSFAESGSLPKPVSADGNPFTRFLNALNPISPAYAQDDDEIPPAELEALLHLLNPEVAKKLIEQNRFWDDYRRELQEVRAGRASSPALARHLEASGIQRPTGYAAHHIVAGNDPPAEFARDVLKRFGIGINDAVNGVFLPANKATQVIAGKTIHSTLHTDAYYEAVNEALRPLTTKQQVIDKLQSIAQALEDGEFP